eukprot:CAMPEP_0119120798 /NCGR_PEP_ID=MMETSP1310-20130426/1693_1 /TAXON_ID=464262 /ORGANISM="Genus nov. species nov., Strain RCC2339" /LENGTH=358 /DNA_ID=CAMNT_0007110303 /DNA_START=45 /DNA_END=1118 /DNA_ORIENTATION=-
MEEPWGLYAGAGCGVLLVVGAIYLLRRLGRSRGKKLSRVEREKRDICYYCFEAIRQRLEEHPPARAPLSLEKDRRDLSLFVKWEVVGPDGERTLVGHKLSTTQRPVLRAIRKAALDSAFNDPGSMQELGDTLDDTPGLECTVRVTVKLYELDVDDTSWELGTDGLVLSREREGRAGKKRIVEKALVMPEKPARKNWSKKETMTYLKERAHTARAGPDEDVTLKAFRLSEPFSMSYRKYRKHAKLVEQEKASGSYLYLFLLVCAVGIMWLKFAEETYDVNYDEFLHNYEILGLPPEAPFADVKKAWRVLGRKYHPDKTKNDPASADLYVQISNAYSQISDYEKGKVHVVGRRARDPRKK